ncbi:hypothetical protein N783_02200 [Pontibacillus marinus BH030004 = DSM 16465]|uniref:Uncharacterized protein n=1 Tax=Pontibacillus marinus BH030004 = DSM 16465 TaxID=1385511 RepID=A0A0A5FTM8_9BACI|nr:hypothetical protein N783_02200 [Pontibacillus marinus BH030004 = DSM 16465]
MKKKNWTLFAILLGLSMVWGIIYWMIFVLK